MLLLMLLDAAVDLLFCCCRAAVDAAVAAVGKDPDAVTGNHDVAAGVYSPTMTQLRMQSMMQLFSFLGSSLYIVMTTAFP